jgi:hypothetical protein
LLERKLFLAAYSLRKLDEAAKLSTATLDAALEVARYAPAKSGYSEINSHRFDEFFDLEKPETAMLPARRLVNVLIHSLVFVEALADDGAIEGFIVTSDYERERGLIHVDMSVFVGLMRRAAEDFPTSFTRRFNSKTGRWRIWSGSSDPPERR